MVVIVIAVAGAWVYGVGRPKTETISAVTWQLREGKTWVPTNTPPPCPDPLAFASPVDISRVTGILYPGQPRENAWKPHGAFVFKNQTNEAIVTVPFDAQVVRGSRAFRNGEHQYSFEFIAPCGIWYSLGHLLELDPKFLAIANKLPLIDDDKEGFHVNQIYDVTPPINVTTGEVIATKVGYAKTNNVVVDFGVLDLRHKNGAKLRPKWAQYAQEFDEYAVCWLDFLPPDDAMHLRKLFGSGDHETGIKSDYCHYPENQ